MTLAFPKAGCKRLFTMMLSEENGSLTRLNEDVFLTDRFFLSEAKWHCFQLCYSLLPFVK